MFMFLPFLIALAVVLAAITGKDKTSYILWAALLIVTVLSFIHHVTDPLSLSLYYENQKSSNDGCPPG